MILLFYPPNQIIHLIRLLFHCFSIIGCSIWASFGPHPQPSLLSEALHWLPVPLQLP